MSAAVIAFLSGKGGTGKSSAVALVGAALAQREKRVLLIEMTVSLRNLDVITGTSKDTVYDLDDVLSGRCAPYKAIVRSRTNHCLFVIAGAYSGGSINEETMSLLIHKMKPYFDYILLDVASGLESAYKSAKSTANLAVFLVTPDPLVLRDARYIADDLPENVKMRMIINKVPQEGLPAGGSIGNLDEIIDHVAVQLIGVVPFSNNVFHAVASGIPLAENSLEQQVYCAIAARIDGEDVPLVFGG